MSDEDLTEMADIVGELSEFHPGDPEDGLTCIFCSGRVPLRSSPSTTLMEERFHDSDDCLWLRASQLVHKIGGLRDRAVAH